ncbi:MAG: polysaccharide export protein [Caulobacteraceae bacterium]|nr:polysaccharide export protein [Caulobacteraceae bacterium]
MRVASAVVLLLALGGCSTLPHDGPSTRSVPRQAAHGAALYALVDLDYAVTQQIAAHPPVALTGLSHQSSGAPNDLIAEGDALGVSVFEAGGGGLFSHTPEIVQLTTGDSQQTLPRLIVDTDGDLVIPFAGPVHVAGLRPAEAAAVIRQALRRRAVDPQVTVTVLESRANSVAIIGQVRNAGHIALSPHNDRLIDVLASAGGPTKQPADLAVVVYRGGRYAEVSLAALMAEPDQNIRLAPGDQIRVVDRPRKYSTFGAFGRDSQTAIEDDTLTLANAMSRAGGLDTYSAAGRSVLVFRFERPEVATALGVTRPPAAKGVPVVYRLDFLNPDSLFVANNFEIRSDDLLYVPRSDITEMKKFFDLINSVTQIGYNVRVTSTIP